MLEGRQASKEASWQEKSNKVGKKASKALRKQAGRQQACTHTGKQAPRLPRLPTSSSFLSLLASSQSMEEPISNTHHTYVGPALFPSSWYHFSISNHTSSFNRVMEHTCAKFHPDPSKNGGANKEYVHTYVGSAPFPPFCIRG